MCGMKENDLLLTTGSAERIRGTHGFQCLRKSLLASWSLDCEELEAIDVDSTTGRCAKGLAFKTEHRLRCYEKEENTQTRGITHWDQTKD